MIYVIRGQKVMLDSDLAALYEVETFNLNKAVKRNIERFPADFMFQLTKEEWENLTFQIGISKKQQHGGRRFMPYAQAAKAAYIIYFLTLADRKKACVYRTRRSNVSVSP